MSRKPPSYLLHKPRRLARVIIHGKTYYLGPYGSPESYARYEELIARWRQEQAELSGPVKPQTTRSQIRTVDDLLGCFWEHAQEKYRGKHELYSYWYALRPVAVLHGKTPIEGFGPRALRAVRLEMVRGFNDPEHGQRPPLTRRSLNRHIGRIKAAWAWAVGEELVDGSAYHRLRDGVPGLERGELGVAEARPVTPVPEEILAGSMAQLPPLILTMVQLQLLTGARPGEILKLRPRDLVQRDRVEISPGVVIETAGLWLVVISPDRRPDDPEAPSHKTAYLGHTRVLFLGPRAQEILAPWLEGWPADEPIFSPARSMRDWRARQREARQTKVQPSQLSRAHPRPLKRPGRSFTSGSYCQAIRRACDRAFPPPYPLGPAVGEGIRAWRKRLTPEQVLELKLWRERHHWHPHQLRHNAATRLVQQFGWDVARIVLGHRTVETTRIYAIDDLAQAAEAMRSVG